MAEEIDIEKILKGIQQLQQLRSELLAGSLSPPGAWIHEYVVKRFYPGSGNTEFYCYAKWQAHQPIFLRHPKQKKRWAEPDIEPGFTQHQHIGRVSSTTGLGTEPEVETAYKQWRNRQRLEAVEKVLREIQAILASAEPLREQ